MDGCADGWICLQESQNSLTANVVSTFAQLLQWVPTDAIIAIDVPRFSGLPLSYLSQKSIREIGLDRNSDPIVFPKQSGSRIFRVKLRLCPQAGPGLNTRCSIDW